jgi:HEAT repeat protein
MLDTLALSESRQLRRALIDRLVRIGPPLGPHLIPRLGDGRWYVVRNLLHLAAELPAAPSGLNAAQYAQHEDLRVRREALRVLFKDPAVRTRAICTALTDQDPRVKRLALAAAADGACPEAAVPLVVALATGDEDSELRVAAIRTLASEGGRLSLDALLRLTRMRRSVLGSVKRVQREPEFLAALAALGRFTGERRAREQLEQAAASKDPETAKIAGDALKGVR